MVTIIMLILGKLNVTVIVNSNQTKTIRIQRGVPQGCALSGDIFILVLECLFKLVEFYPEKFGEGVSMIPEGTKVLDMEFADDVNAFARKNVHILAWIEALDQFKFPSGITPNLSKTKINLVGRSFWGDPQADEHGRKCKSILEKELKNRIGVGIADDIKLVGVTLSIRKYKGATPPDVGKVSITQGTWDTRLKTLTPYARYQKYILKNQPLLSKIIPINETMARLWYIMPTCPPNLEEAKKVAGLVDMMLFAHSTPLIRRTIYTQNTEKPGGLNAPHTTYRIQSLNSMWIRLYTLSDLPKCLQEYMQSIIQKINGDTMMDQCPLTQVNLSCSKVKFKHSDFNHKKEVYPSCIDQVNELLTQA